MNEYGTLLKVAIRRAEDAFVSDSKIEAQWQALRFHQPPALTTANAEYEAFERHLSDSGAETIILPASEDLSLDAIYTRDALVLTPDGLILCNMGRPSRNDEPATNAIALVGYGEAIIGGIDPPGTLEGGDMIWINETAAAVGLGPRTNQDGINQLELLLGRAVDLHVVPLPDPEHPEDVFHLMSMISPLDKDLALIYRPLMPESFLTWLEGHGIGFVDVPQEEYQPMGCNVLALGPRKLLMLDSLPKTKAKLEAADCEVLTYKGNEISRKGEGGPTCLTRPLERA